MSTKEKLLEFLESNRNEYFSGEELARRFNVSRQALWKAVKLLQNEGYPIEGTTNKGYRLEESSDIISKQGIEKFLKEEIAEIIVLKSTTSTNYLAKERALNNALDKTVIISNEQTSGKAKYSKKFFSPKETGIYMSIILKPLNFLIEDAYKLSSLACLSLSESINKLTNKISVIKEKNEIYLDDKKIAGILSEASFELETKMVEYLVIGIGINVYLPKEGFPNSLECIAGAIYDDSTSDFKNNLVGEFLNIFFEKLKKWSNYE